MAGWWRRKALFPSPQNSLEEGKSLTEPLKESAVFPAMVYADDRRRAKQTGAMDAMLQERIADFLRGTKWTWQ